MDLSKSRAALERAEADLAKVRKHSTVNSDAGSILAVAGKLAALELEIAKTWTQVELLETERS